MTAASTVARISTSASDTGMKPSSAGAWTTATSSSASSTPSRKASKIRAHPAHAEDMEFGGAQSAHAGGARHMDALVERPQDFLVPDGRHLMEIAVDDADDGGPAVADQPVDIALTDRRKVIGVEHRRGLRARQGRPQEYRDAAHRLAP